MDVSKRNLLISLVGIAILLVGALAYAQFNASQNYDLPELRQPE